MDKDLKFFLTSLNYSLNKGSKFKFTELEQDNKKSELNVYKTDLGKVTFFIQIAEKNYNVYISKDDKFDLESITELGVINESLSTIKDSSDVSTLILKYVESDLIQDLIDLGTFGFEIVGIQKLEKQVKLCFLIKDSNGKCLLRQDTQEYVKSIYFKFDKAEAELALILLNISGNGNITEMNTKFIPSPNTSNPNWDLYNGGVLYELEHCIAWVINNKYYKVQHLKK
jgi:hypothetical protein